MTYLSELVKGLYDLNDERERVENASQKSLQDAQRLQGIKESMKDITKDIGEYIKNDLKHRSINKITDPTNMVAATEKRQSGRRPFGQCANNPYCLIFE